VRADGLVSEIRVFWLIRGRAVQKNLGFAFQFFETFCLSVFNYAHFMTLPRIFSGKNHTFFAMPKVKNVMS
jgi:hypothetical protein